MAAALAASAAFLAYYGAPAAYADHGVDETIWSATLTAGETTFHRGYIFMGAFGALSDNDFTHGGATYQISTIQVRTSDRELDLILAQTIPDNLKSVLTLHVGNAEFHLANAAISNSGASMNNKATWSNSGLSWSAGDTVQLSLTGPVSPPGVDLSRNTLAIPSETGFATFTVALTADPGAQTTIHLVKTQYFQSGYGQSGHRWNLEAADVSPETLTFNSTNYGDPQTVTVTGVADDDHVPEQLAILVLERTQSYGYVWDPGNGSYDWDPVNGYTRNSHGNGTHTYRLVASYGPVGGAYSSVTGIHVTVADPCDTCSTEGDLGVISTPEQVTPAEEEPAEEQGDPTEQAATIPEDEGQQPPQEELPPPVENAAPVITLSGPVQMSIQVGAAYIEPGYTAADPEDGDLTASVTVTGTVDAAQTGTYTIHYDVTDSSGKAALQQSRTVTVTAPVPEDDGDGGSPPAPDQEPADAVTRYDADGDGTISQQEWLVAVEDYESGLLTNAEIYAISKAR